MTVFEELSEMIGRNNNKVGKRQRRKQKIKETDKIIGIEFVNKQQVETMCGRSRFRFTSEDGIHFSAYDGKNEHTIYLDYIGERLMVIDDTQIPLSAYDKNVKKEKFEWKSQVYYTAALLFEITMIGLDDFIKKYKLGIYEFNRPEIDLSFFKREDCALGFVLEEKEYLVVREENQLYIKCDDKKIPVTDIIPGCDKTQSIAKYVSENPKEFKDRLLSILYGKCVDTQNVEDANIRRYENADVLTYTVKNKEITSEVEIVKENAGNVSYVEIIKQEGNPSRRVIRATYNKESKKLRYINGDNDLEFRYVELDYNKICVVLNALNECVINRLSFNIVRLIIDFNATDISFGGNKVTFNSSIGEIDGAFEIDENGLLIFKSEFDNGFFEFTGLCGGFTIYNIWNILYNVDGKQVELSYNDGLYKIYGDGLIIDYNGGYNLTPRQFAWFYDCAIDAYNNKYCDKLTRKKPFSEIEEDDE